jgi:hypothetical protein
VPADDRGWEIGPNTKTTLSVVASCITIFLGGALWITTSLGSMERSILELSHRVDTLDTRLRALEGTTDDRWRRSDMKAWVRDAKERNPSLSLPSVE